MRIIRKDLIGSWMHAIIFNSLAIAVGEMRVRADWVSQLGIVTVVALAFVGPANPKEFGSSEPRKALTPVLFLKWSGFYAGGHLGYGRGHANDSFADPLTAG